MLRALTTDAAIPRLAASALIDVRDEAAFDAGHLAGSGHVPLEAFRERRAELPPRDRACLLLADDPAVAADAARALEALGYRDVSWLDGSLAALPGGHASRGPAARLWRPAPFLEAMLPRLPMGRALDVAAGNGREAVFLAIHGWRVEAWDIAPEALRNASALAARHGVAIETVVADLERRDAALPESRYDVVLCFRFLHRPLFPMIERALVPGGCLVYETFRTGQERFGRPLSRKYLLGGGELSASFPSLEVEHYAEQEPAGGPVTAQLLARRPVARGPDR
jgi:tellurite methyltransferase